MSQYINFNNLSRSLNKFNKQKPFPFAIVDNFFKTKIANKLEKEFPKYKDKKLHEYNNYCEVKKSLNNWNFFPPLTYKIFTILNSEKILNLISKKTKIKKIFPDFGLHGGGWHLMNSKGRLNPHLDYYIHPKTFKMRKFNLIIFLTKNWKKNWGGDLYFYSKNLSKNNMPGKLVTKVYSKFNRAVIFDTSAFSWHSVSSIKVNRTRKTIAVYYLANVKNKIIKREKALYSPTIKQLNNKKVLNFIKLRANSKSFKNVYKTR